MIWLMTKELDSMLDEAGAALLTKKEEAGRQLIY
jgi:hypothetical protein